MPTDDEWLAAKNAVGKQLTGDLWEWTQTIYNGVSRILRSLEGSIQYSNDPGGHYSGRAVRLVEDK